MVDFYDTVSFNHLSNVALAEMAFDVSVELRGWNDKPACSTDCKPDVQPRAMIQQREIKRTTVVFRRRHGVVEWDKRDFVVIKIPVTRSKTAILANTRPCSPTTRYKMLGFSWRISDVNDVKD